MDDIVLKRTDSDDADFKSLVILLDADMASRYGNLQLLYNGYNKIESNNTVLVAYRHGKPVGCGCFKGFDAETVEIKRMFVDPELRGKGVGLKIMNELEKWAREKGYTSTVLETGHKQPEALHLYNKLGYSLTANYGQYKHMESSICMRRAL